MFGWLARRTKVFKEIADDLKHTKHEKECLETEIKAIIEQHSHILEDFESLEDESDALKERIKQYESNNPLTTEDAPTSVLFKMDDKLNVTVNTVVNKDIVTTLIDKEYITSEHSEDEAMLQLAVLLVAYEVCDQLIEGVNENGEEA